MCDVWALPSQAVVEDSQGVAAQSKGKSSLSKGKATPPKDSQEPFSQADGEAIEPPVMLSHLANPKSAGLKESLKMKMSRSGPLPTQQISKPAPAQPLLQSPAAVSIKVSDM